MNPHDREPHDSQPREPETADVDRPAGTGDLPREIEPPRDLWTGIAARIRTEARVEAPAGSSTDRPNSVIRGRFDAWRRPLLVAATLAIVFLAG